MEFAGGGLRPRTIREARAMARGEMTADKVRRMAAWLARHEGDLRSPRANAYLDGTSDRPTAGQVAWLLWGGDLGRANRGRAKDWADRTRDRLIGEGKLTKAEPSEVKVGTSVQYAVPKPPDPTTYANGVVTRLQRMGTVEIGQERREGTAEDPAAVVQVFARDGDEFIETDRRVVRNVSELRVIPAFDDQVKSLYGKVEPGWLMDTRKQVSDRVRSALREKVEAHNERYTGKGQRATVRMLEAVFERGIGAYRTNPGSVRPTVTSAEQWAYARVNAFLTALRTGRFPRRAFDTDLLPEGHPLSSKD